MSLFITPSKELIESIQWFNNLQNNDRISLLQTPLNNINIVDPLFSQYIILIREIQNALIDKTRDEIVSKLKDLGIESTSASLLVSKILDEAPPIQTDIKLMNDTADQSFKKTVDEVISTFITNIPIETQKRSIDFNSNIFKSVHRLMREVILWKYVRGELSLETIKSVLKDHYKFSDQKIEIVSKGLENNVETLRNNYIFRNTQDTFVNIEKLMQSQQQLVTEVRELTAYLKQLYRNYGAGQPSAIQ